MKTLIVALVVVVQAALLVNGQTWGVINDQSRRLVDFRASRAGGFELVTMAKTFTFDDTVRGIRATVMNNTIGTAQVVSGLDQQTVNMQFTGAPTGGAFDFRVEIFTSSAFVKSISLLLMVAAYFFVKIMS